MSQQRSSTARFKALTWDDLEAWAGSKTVSRGRSYQRSGQVQGLALTPTGGVVAWVSGTQRYATRVELDADELTSTCTCPVGITCKHAVAVVLDYLAHLEQKRAVPTVTEQDRRLVLLADTEAWDTEDEEDDADDEDNATPRRSHRPAAVRAFLEQQTRAQLIALLEELAERHAAVREALQDRCELATRDVARLVQTVRRDIAELSAEPAWSNDWDDEGSVPDYSRVQERLEALLAQGHADEVVTLGEELLEAGTQQVEMSQDEGETAEAIGACMAVVFRALAQSSHSPVEQMLWAIDAELENEYNLCQGADDFWEQERASTDWQALAEQLTQRLRRHTSPQRDDSPGDYYCDQLVDWLIYALEQAGQHDEIIPLCEREVERTGNYLRLVERLKAAERWADAERWIHQGIEATRQRWPGIAGQLRTALRELREHTNDWPVVAALRAEDFFRQPALQTFQELQRAAERAGVWPAVRAAALHYLETGELPQATRRTRKGQAAPAWPLPATGVPMDPTGELRLQLPMTGTLMAIAIAEKRPDEVLRWYDQRRPTPYGTWGWSEVSDNQVAEAVAEAYPDRALAIWKRLAEAEIARTDTRAYETAAGYLRKAQRLLEGLDRSAEWHSYLTTLRQANARKRRLLEILDHLGDRRIVKGV